MAAKSTEGAPVIESFKHKGLKRFFESGGTYPAGINAGHRNKLRDQLAALDSAESILDMRVPGWRLHSLKGKSAGRYAVDVSGNWRLTFEFEGGLAYSVDYEDYH